MATATATATNGGTSSVGYVRSAHQRALSRQTRSSRSTSVSKRDPNRIPLV
jgi:hypothetical protein